MASQGGSRIDEILVLEIAFAPVIGMLFLRGTEDGPINDQGLFGKRPRNARPFFMVMDGRLSERDHLSQPCL